MPTVIIQARMGSSRLPGKVMLPILGKPLLWWTVEALKMSKVIDRIVLAIPDREENNCLLELAMEMNINCFVGPEKNVLQRFFQCSQEYSDDVYFRATGDNPIIDYENPERLFVYRKIYGLQYAFEEGLPIGAGIEIFTRDAINIAYQKAVSNYDKEHVTAYMMRNLKKEHVEGLTTAPFNGSYYPELSLTVDTPNDYKKIKMIMANTHRDGIPPIEKVVEFCRENEIT